MTPSLPVHPQVGVSAEARAAIAAARRPAAQVPACRRFFAPVSLPLLVPGMAGSPPPPPSFGLSLCFQP